MVSVVKSRFDGLKIEDDDEDPQKQSKNSTLNNRQKQTASKGDSINKKQVTKVHDN